MATIDQLMPLLQMLLYAIKLRQKDNNNGFKVVDGSW
jgi:hypothetical protein